MIDKPGRKTLLLLLLCLLVPALLSAQTAVKFTLERHDDGHYYFYAPICGQQEEIMLESGIPGLLVGRGFYEKYMKNSGLKFEQSEAKVRLLNDVYPVAYQANGSLNVGKVVFDGPVFVLENFDGFSLPVQYLKAAGTGKKVVTVDLAELYFSVGGPLTRQGTKFKLFYDKSTHRPFINASFTIDGIEFSGKLLVDFGNPMLLFLFRQHRCVNNAVVRKQIEIQDGYDSQGRLVSKGFSAKSVKLYGTEYKNLIIGVTGKYRNATELGFLGTPFFDAPVVFDFEDGWMYKQIK